MTLFRNIFVYIGITAILPLTLFSIELTQDEKSYLQKMGTINVCVDPDWEPFEWIDAQKNYRGIGADLLYLVTERLGLSVNVLKTDDWTQSIAFSKQGKCHIISFLNETPSRDEWLLFTRPHFNDPNVFITREEHALIDDPSILRHETIAFPSGTAMEEYIRLTYPNLHVVVTNSEKEALNLVDTKKADMSMRSLIMAAYIIKQEGWFNLKIAGELPQYTNHLSMGVSKSEPMLRDILNKGIVTITDADREKIVNKYVSVKIETTRNYRFIAVILFIVLMLGFILAWRNLQLKRHNKELLYLSETDTLTKIYNRAKIERELIAEVERSHRLKQELSILLLDIDHFKNVNDTFGHATGDHVLSQFALSMKESLRKYDVIGRWGGEEFLIICKNGNELEAYSVALRIQDTLGKTVFATKQTHTISIGLATLRPDETPYMLLSRADEALYNAKNKGRNRIEYEQRA